jgi:hypothetical protein
MHLYWRNLVYPFKLNAKPSLSIAFRQDTAVPFLPLPTSHLPIHHQYPTLVSESAVGTKQKALRVTPSPISESPRPSPPAVPESCKHQGTGQHISPNENVQEWFRNWVHCEFVDNYLTQFLRGRLFSYLISPSKAPCSSLNQMDLPQPTLFLR